MKWLERRRERRERRDRHGTLSSLVTSELGRLWRERSHRSGSGFQNEPSPEWAGSHEGFIPDATWVAPSVQQVDLLVRMIDAVACTSSEVPSFVAFVVDNLPVGTQVHITAQYATQGGTDFSGIITTEWETWSAPTFSSLTSEVCDDLARRWAAQRLGSQDS
jgi:hypothetical protein